MRVRFHNVYLMGATTSTAVGKIARASRAEADRSGLRGSSMRRVGVWKVTDHAETIADLCGPFGRPADSA